jgi:hypothetical protein
LVKRHPALQEVDFPTRFIFQVLQGLSPERATAIINDEETNPQFDETIICQDLLASLGERQSHSLTDKEGNMSVEQLKKLDLVWYGERRLAEIVAVIPR